MYCIDKWCRNWPIRDNIRFCAMAETSCTQNTINLSIISWNLFGVLLETPFFTDMNFCHAANISSLKDYAHWFSYASLFRCGRKTDMTDSLFHLGLRQSFYNNVLKVNFSILVLQKKTVLSRLVVFFAGKTSFANLMENNGIKICFFNVCRT